MRLFFLVATLGLSTAVYAQDETEIPAADEWYKTQYAVLYDDKPWDKVDEIASFYAENMHVHGEDGGSFNSREWIAEELEGWKIEGWIRSELADLESELLNPNTATFKTKWRDYYTGGNIDYECSWYLSDFKNGKWLISEYAIIDCNEHGM